MPALVLGYLLMSVITVKCLGPKLTNIGAKFKRTTDAENRARRAFSPGYCGRTERNIFLSLDVIIRTEAPSKHEVPLH